MAVTRIKGVNTLEGGQYEELILGGVVTANGDLKASSVEIGGVVTLNGSLESDSFIKIGGVVTANQALRAKTMEVGGVVTLHGGVEADVIQIRGVVTAKQQVSADLVESRGVFSAEEVVGDRVIIHCVDKTESNGRGLFHWLRKWNEKRTVQPRVGTIEATEIDVDGIRADNLNGQNIMIGPRCIVENVDCSGRLAIAPGAVVKYINGQAYTK